MKTKLISAVIILLMANCSLTSLTLHAQVADTLALPEITIDARKFDVDASRISTFLSIYDFDFKTSMPASTVGDILKRNSRFIIRSYGPGQAQTSGTIGFTPSQVKVMWNGMDLNHPMLGLTDLSLIPIALLDDITVDNHLGSSEYGANAMGGVIQLESGSFQNEETILGVSVGSYGNQNYQIATSQRLGKWYVKTGIVYADQVNDFEYEDVSGSSMTRQNSDKNQITGLFSAGYQHEKYWNNTSIWLSSGETGSPGSKNYPSLDARQTDKAMRGIHTSNWMHTESTISQFSVSFNQIQLDYVDPSFQVNSSSKSRLSNVSYSIKNRWSKQFQLRGRASYELGAIESNDYELSSVVHSSAQLNGLMGPMPWMLFYPSIRFDSYSEFKDSWSYGIGLNIEAVSNKLFFISNINRNYAPPTFNDLYWPTFGNPDLIPETSVKFDVGVHYVTSFVSLKTSYFNSFVEDGIIWWVDSTGAYRPSNVNQISTDGITIEALHSSIINDLSLDFSIGYTHLKSTYDSRDGSDAVVGNTVVYTPSNKINASLNVDYKSLGLLVDYQYTDKRFTYDSNTTWLDPFHLVDVEIYQMLPIKKVNVSLKLGILNLFDVEYEQIMDYPMPGRMIESALSVKF